MGGGVFGLGAELNTTAARTPYKEMVDKIYRELTILGLISFGTFLFLQSKTAVDHDILIAFEFSHIVIFFAALNFVLSAVGMMYLNSRIKREIDVASMLDTDILVKRFEENKASLTGWRIFFSQDAQKLKYDIRFKAYNMFFCDHYKFPVSAFDFSSYMREVLDKHVTKLLEVEISSWFFLCVLLCINIIRSEIVASSSGCDGDGDGDGDSDGDSDSDSDSDTSGRRFLANSTSSRCGGNDGLLFFMATGWAMLLSVCFLKLVAMRSESHLLKLMGCGNLELCIDYMKRVEKKLLAEEALLVELHKKRQGGDVDLKDEEEKTQTFTELSFNGNGAAPKVGQVAVSSKRKAELLSALKAEPSSNHLHPKQNSEHQHHHQHHHDPVKDDAILGAIVAGVSTVGKVLAPTSLRNLSASGRRPSSSSNEDPFAVPEDSPKSTPHRAVSQYRS
ncbi:hypothetical protein TrST_g14124 [Triparma strigata]|uniref:Uncharacterized protein n=1 Tax=Triparma strigata TaxID=1606541 RepID=A0A9W7ACS2_9STRA|nr:hypothetical protein TrST_g14124 [Triparma strigata]